MKTAVSFALLFFLLLSPTLLVQNGECTLHHIVVNQTACFKQSCPAGICCSLEEALSSKKIIHGTEVIIENFNEVLSTLIVVTGLRNFMIRGSNKSVTILCDSSGKILGGLQFNQMHNLSICSLKLRNCGSKETELKWTHYPAGILITNSSGVNLSSIELSNNSFTSLWLVDTTGDISITNSEFGLLTFAGREQRTVKGIIIEYPTNHNKTSLNINNCYFLSTSVSYQFDRSNVLSATESGGGLFLSLVNINSSNYHITDSWFISNNGVNGGGLAVVVAGVSSSINVIMTNCSFAHNQAIYGGGAYLLITAQATNNSITINNCSFISNHLSQRHNGQYGGGILASFSFQHHRNLKNQILINDSKFINNSAQFGGGLALLCSKSLQSTYSSSITVANSVWTENFAYFGSAVDISPDVNDKITSGFAPKVCFRDCKFFNNYVTKDFFNKDLKHKNKAHFGKGMFYTTSVEVWFESETTFSQNSGSSIVSVSAVLHFNTSNATWLENTGLEGAALLLQGITYVRLYSDSHLYFINNTAFNIGGAVHVNIIDNHLFFSALVCPFKYYDSQSVSIPPSQWNATVTFSNNRAEADFGGSLFITSLKPCIKAYNLSKLVVNDIFSGDNTGGFTFSANGSIRNDIATSGSHFKAPNESIKVYLGHIYFLHNYTIFNVAPGDKVQPQIIFLDELDHPLKDIELLAVVDDGNGYVYTKYTRASHVSVNIYGKQNTNVTLQLQTTDLPLVSLEMTVMLTNCHYGYQWLNNSKRCGCNAIQYYGASHCKEGLGLIVKDGIWAGVVNNTFVTAPCSFWICRQRVDYTNHFIAPTYKINKKPINCPRNRTGILCSECKVNHTVYYNSPSFACYSSENCSTALGTLLYIVSTLLPITVVFFLVVVSGVNFASGYIQGFVLYAQVVSCIDLRAGGSFILSHKVETLQTVPLLIYGMMDLKFLHLENLSFCIHRHISSMEIIGIRYLSYCYAFLLILMFIFLIRPCAMRLMRHSKCVRITAIKPYAVHGVSTWLILCYSSCTKAALWLLKPTPLYAEGPVMLPNSRVTIRGSLVYFSKMHLVYAIPAIISFMTITIIPPLLLLYPLIIKLLSVVKLENSAITRFLGYCFMQHKLKPLYDVFQSPFKDECRFFASLYFIYRFILLLVSFFMETYTNYFTSLAVALGVMLFIHSVAQPYANRLHNIIDTLLLTNLLIVSFCSLYLLKDSEGSPHTAANIQTMMLYLPLLLVLLVGVCYCCYRHQKRVAPAAGIVSFLDWNRAADTLWGRQNSERVRLLNNVN